MTILSFTLIMITQLCAVTGQIFLKKSVNRPDSEGKTKSILLTAAGILKERASASLWLGVLLIGAGVALVSAN